MVQVGKSTPVSAKTYMNAGLPWFDIYDADKDAISATEELKKIKSILKLDNMAEDLPVIHLHHKNNTVKDGKW